MRENLSSDFVRLLLHAMNANIVFARKSFDLYLGSEMYVIVRVEVVFVWQHHHRLSPIEANERV